MTVVGALWGWLLTGYLVWRAWPGIRADVRSVRRFLGLGRFRGRYAGKGGL